MRGGGWIGLQLALTLTVVLPPAVSNADTLVVCTEASPDFLNAQLSTTSFDVSEQVFDRLVELKPGTSELVPGLAESWTISPDGLLGAPGRVACNLRSACGVVRGSGSGGLQPPAASRCSARKLAARSFPPRPPA